MAPLIIAAKSIFVFDSNPPVASVRPSLLNASEVTFRPIVPADRPPSTLVIIAEMSAMFGMIGIWPGLMTGGVNELIGDDVRSRSLLPDAASQSEICPEDPIVPRRRPSAA